MNANARIYLMQATDGTLKLGRSVAPDRRAKELLCDVSIVHQTEPLPQAGRIERLAHRVLALSGHHIRCEWFVAKVEDAIGAIEIAIKQAENQELALGGSLNRGNQHPLAGEILSRAKLQANFRITEDDMRMVTELRQTVLNEAGKVPTETDIWRMALRSFYEGQKKRGRK